MCQPNPIESVTHQVFARRHNTTRIGHPNIHDGFHVCCEIDHPGARPATFIQGASRELQVSGTRSGIIRWECASLVSQGDEHGTQDLQGHRPQGHRVDKSHGDHPAQPHRHRLGISGFHLPGPDRHRDHGQSLGALRRRTRHRLLRRRGRRAHPVRQAHRPPVPRLLPRHRPPEPRDVPALRRRREALRRQDRVHLPRRRRRDQARQRQRNVLILRRRPQGMLRRSQSSATATKTRYPQRVGHRPAQGPEPRHEDGGPGGPGGSSLRGRVGRSRIADQVQPADQRDFARECGTSSASWARR